MTVNGDRIQSNNPAGGSPVKGTGGKKAIKVRAPMVMIGAVSPMALDKPIMTPVNMPGVE